MPLLLPELFLPVFVVLGALVLIGLAQTATAQHGSETTGGFWAGFKKAFLFGQAASWISHFTRYVVSRFAGSHLRLVAKWLTGLGTLVLHSYGYQADVAVATRDAVRDLYVHGDRTARRDVHKANLAITRANTAIRHTNAAVARDAKALNRYKAHTNARLRIDAHAIDVAIPHELGQIRARNKALEKGQARTRDDVKALEDGAIDTFRWIRTHPLTATTGVFAGAVAVALGRLGLGGLRCNNFKNLLHNYGCGLGTLLGRLLPLAVFLTIAFDFGEFVKASEIVAKGIGGAVGKIEGEFALSLPPLPPPQV